MRNLRQERFDQLDAVDVEDQTQEQMNELAQLHHELNPDSQWWGDNRTPQEIWGHDTSCYDR